MIRVEGQKAVSREDLISKGVGNLRYVQPWYPEGLTARIHGYRAKETVRISRWYFEPRIAIDFEPDPRDERFYVDEKRQWCTEQKVTYVPIFLADQLTLDQFAERIRAAQTLLKAGRLEQRELRMLDAGMRGVAVVEDPEVAKFVAEEAGRRHAAGIAEGKNWRGFARDAVIKKCTREIIAEIEEKYPSGRVGPEYRAHLVAHAAGGQG